MHGEVVLGEQAVPGDSVPFKPPLQDGSLYPGKHSIAEGNQCIPPMLPPRDTSD